MYLILKTICMMCMILSPNCSAVTLFAKAQLMCMPFASSKRTEVERPSKTSEEEEKCVASAIPR